MFALFCIVAMAVLMVASQTARPRRCVLGLIGSFCLLLGLQAGVLLTESTSTNFASSAAVAQETGEAEVQPEVTSNAEIDELTITLDNTEKDGTAPIERMTKVVFLDAERYPEWLREPPARSDFSLASTKTDDGMHYAVVKSALGMSNSECDRDLDQRLLEAAHDYINDYLDSPRAALLLRYSADEIRERLVQATFQESIFFEHQETEMRKAHALLGFGDAFRRELDERWRQVVATVRLTQTGLGAAVVLMLLGTLFSYFRFDTATRGYYTGRLQFATAAAILAVVAAGVLVSKWIPWM